MSIFKKSSDFRKMSKTINTLFIILILLLPTQLGRHFWPSWSLVDGVRVDYLAPTVYLTDILILILGLSVLFQKTQKTLTARYPQKIRGSENQRIRLSGFLNFRISGFPSFLSVLILTLALLTAYWIYIAERRWLAGYWVLRYLEIPLAAWLTIRVIREIGEIRAIKRIINILSVGILFSVGLGIAQMVLGGTTGWFWILGERSFTAATPGVATMTVLGREILRPYATFPHPNALAGFLAAVIMILIRTKAIRDHWKTIGVWAGVFGVILTGSRGAMIGSVVSYGLWVARLPAGQVGRGVRNWKKFVKLAGLGILALLVGWRIMGAVRFVDEAVMERTVLAEAAGKMLRENWLTGVGPGQFLVKLPEFLPAGFYKIQPVHNVFLLLLTEFGVIGGGICLIGLIWLIRRIKSIPKWLAVLAVILVTGMLDHYWLTAQQNRLLLGVILGFWASGRR